MIHLSAYLSLDTVLFWIGLNLPSLAIATMVACAATEGFPPKIIGLGPTGLIRTITQKATEVCKRSRRAARLDHPYKIWSNRFRLSRWVSVTFEQMLTQRWMRT